MTTYIETTPGTGMEVSTSDRLAIGTLFLAVGAAAAGLLLAVLATMSTGASRSNKQEER